MSRPSISLATSAVLVTCMELALSLSKRTTISPVSTAYRRARSIERSRATAMRMRRQYQAVFIDGPAKGRVQALAGPMSEIRFAEMPNFTARLLEESTFLEVKDIDYRLRGHYAPCGRGKFYRE